jgi:uncharacterized protein YcgI (DUF1989 family)
MAQLLTIPTGHETLIAPCDSELYGLLGRTHYHDTCRDNMHAGLAEFGFHIPYTPDPLNMFLNTLWQENSVAITVVLFRLVGHETLFKILR